MNISRKALSTLIATAAVTAIPATAQAQYYYPSYPTYPSVQSYPSHQDSYQRFNQRMREKDAQHQRQLDLIWGR